MTDNKSSGNARLMHQEMDLNLDSKFLKFLYVQSIVGRKHVIVDAPRYLYMMLYFPSQYLYKSLL